MILIQRGDMLLVQKNWKQTMEMDMTEDLEAEEKWCELLGKGEQLNAKENVAVDSPEDEEKDCCSETKRTADERCQEEIKTAPRPMTKKKVRSFLKLFNCYRDKIPSFAAISALLRDLTCKGQPNKIKYGEVQKRTFQSLQECLPESCVSNLLTI